MLTEDISKRIMHAQALIDIKRPERAIEQREPEKAYACARRAVEASPNNLSALYWLTYLEGDRALALKHATRLVELAPEQGFSHTMRAHALARNFQWEDALREAREGARLDPEDPFV